MNSKNIVRTLVLGSLFLVAALSSAAFKPAPQFDMATEANVAQAHIKSEVKSVSVETSASIGHVVQAAKITPKVAIARIIETSSSVQTCRKYAMWQQFDHGEANGVLIWDNSGGGFE